MKRLFTNRVLPVVASLVLIVSMFAGMTFGTVSATETAATETSTTTYHYTMQDNSNRSVDAEGNAIASSDVFFGVPSGGTSSITSVDTDGDAVNDKIVYMQGNHRQSAGQGVISKRANLSGGFTYSTNFFARTYSYSSSYSSYFSVNVGDMAFRFQVGSSSSVSATTLTVWKDGVQQSFDEEGTTEKSVTPYTYYKTGDLKNKYGIGNTVTIPSNCLNVNDYYGGIAIVKLEGNTMTLSFDNTPYNNTDDATVLYTTTVDRFDYEDAYVSAIGDYNNGNYSILDAEITITESIADKAIYDEYYTFNSTNFTAANSSWKTNANGKSQGLLITAGNTTLTTVATAINTMDLTDKKFRYATQMATWKSNVIADSVYVTYKFDFGAFYALVAVSTANTSSTIAYNHKYLVSVYQKGTDADTLLNEKTITSYYHHRDTLKGAGYAMNGVASDKFGSTTYLTALGTALGFAVSGDGDNNITVECLAHTGAAKNVYSYTFNATELGMDLSAVKLIVSNMGKWNDREIVNGYIYTLKERVSDIKARFDEAAAYDATNYTEDEYANAQALIAEYEAMTDEDIKAYLADSVAKINKFLYDTVKVRFDVAAAYDAADYTEEEYANAQALIAEYEAMTDEDLKEYLADSVAKINKFLSDIELVNTLLTSDYSIQDDSNLSAEGGKDFFTVSKLTESAGNGTGYLNVTPNGKIVYIRRNKSTTSYTTAVKSNSTVDLSGGFTFSTTIVGEQYYMSSGRVAAENKITIGDIVFDVVYGEYSGNSSTNSGVKDVANVTITNGETELYALTDVLSSFTQNTATTWKNAYGFTSSDKADDGTTASPFYAHISYGGYTATVTFTYKEGKLTVTLSNPYTGDLKATLLDAVAVDPSAFSDASILMQVRENSGFIMVGPTELSVDIDTVANIKTQMAAYETIEELTEENYTKAVELVALYDSLENEDAKAYLKNYVVFPKAYAKAYDKAALDTEGVEGTAYEEIFVADDYTASKTDSNYAMFDETYTETSLNGSTAEKVYRLASGSGNVLGIVGGKSWGQTLASATYTSNKGYNLGQGFDLDFESYNRAQSAWFTLSVGDIKIVNVAPGDSANGKGLGIGGSDITTNFYAPRYTVYVGDTAVGYYIEDVTDESAVDGISYTTVNLFSAYNGDTTQSSSANNTLSTQKLNIKYYNGTLTISSTKSGNTGSFTVDLSAYADTLDFSNAKVSIYGKTQWSSIYNMCIHSLTGIFNGSDVDAIDHLVAGGYDYQARMYYDAAPAAIQELVSDETKAALAKVAPVTFTAANGDGGSATVAQTFDADEFIDGTAQTFAHDDYVYAGKAVTITATANEGYEFKGWYDYNNRLVSDEASYTVSDPSTRRSYYYNAIFVLTSNDEDTLFTVTINAKNGRTYYKEITISEEITSTSMADILANDNNLNAVITNVAGYTFSGTWTDADGTIVANADAISTDITVAPNYTADTTTYEIHVDNELLGEYEYNTKITVTNENEAFTRWEQVENLEATSGITVSYSPEYTFFVSGVRYLVGVVDGAGAGEALINITYADLTNESVFTILSERALPAEYTFVEAGIILTANADYTDKLTLANVDNVNVKKGTTSSTSANGQYMVKTYASEAFAAVAYLEYTDAEGNLYIIYSDKVSK